MVQNEVKKTGTVLPYDTENKAQENAYNLIANTNKSFFLTGRAGTGKTTFLRRVRESVDKNFVVVAPTGIAAIVAGGETIHSFFGMSLDVQTKNSTYNINQAKQQILQKVDTIIVDEASMVRCDIVDAMDRILRVIMKNKLPFGGKQVVFSGDIFQLDPVVKANGYEQEMLRDLYNVDMPYFYKAHVFERTELIAIEFEKVYRQEDEQFLKILGHIRDGKCYNEDIEVLNKRVGLKPKKGEMAITLASHNKTADGINKAELDAIKGEEKVYVGEVKGDFKDGELPVAKELRLKVGAQVMLCRNDVAKRWVNGTLAKVVALNEASVTVEIGGIEYEVEPIQWEHTKHVYDKKTKKLDKEVVGTYAQLPVRLAWAITIHKSQGMTFEKMVLDLSRGVFMAGQLYVALSRVRSLDGLYLTSPVKTSYIRPKYEALDFAKSFNDEHAIGLQLGVSEAIYKLLLDNDHDEIVRVLYTMVEKALAEGRKADAEWISKEMMVHLVDDTVLSNAQLGMLKTLVASDPFLIQYMLSLALYRAGRYKEADAINCQLYGQNPIQRDGKLLFHIVRTNAQIGDDTRFVYKELLRTEPRYLPIYMELREEMHRQNEGLSVVEEASSDDADSSADGSDAAAASGISISEVIADWNDKTMTSDEWKAKYQPLRNEKSFEVLRKQLMKFCA